MMTNKRLVFVTTFIALTSLAAPAFASGHGGEVHAVYIVGVVLNFLIFVGLLVKFGRPALNKHYAQQREELIENLDAAKRLREKAEEKLKEYQARLDGLETERKEILERYHVQGENERDRLIGDAEVQIEKMKANAKTLIKQEQLRAIKELEQEAVDLAVRLAEDKLRKQVNERTDQRMIEQLSHALKNEVA